MTKLEREGASISLHTPLSRDTQTGFRRPPRGVVLQECTNPYTPYGGGEGIRPLRPSRTGQ